MDCSRPLEILPTLTGISCRFGKAAKGTIKTTVRGFFKVTYIDEKDIPQSHKVNASARDGVTFLEVIGQGGPQKSPQHDKGYCHYCWLHARIR